MATGSAINGRTQTITVGSVTLNCTGDVPLAPAMNGPSTEIQAFQEGDAMAVTVDGGYQATTVTCEYVKSSYDALDAARAAGTVQSCTLGGSSGFSGNGIVTVSEGPTIIANGNRVPTMTVQIDWTSTKVSSSSN